MEDKEYRKAFFLDLPKPIRDHIEEILRENYLEMHEDGFGVHELIYCLRKAYYRRKLGEKIFPTEDQLWWIYRGKLFHRVWGSLFEKNEVKGEHITPSGIRIIGHADIIHDGCVYELKSVNSLEGVPREWHEKQVKAYSFIFGMKKAKIVYISFRGVRVVDVPTDDAEEVIRELERRAEVLKTSLDRDIPPDPSPLGVWECRFCPFREYCEGDWDGEDAHEI